VPEYVELEEGFVIDAETGEVIDCPTGEDPLFMAAQRFYDAKQQAKEWGARAGLYQQVLLRGQESKRAQYGPVVISTRRDFYTSFDAEGFRQWAENEELPAQAWRAFALAAKGFDRGLIPDEDLRGLIEDYFEQKEKAPFAMASPVTQRAPAIRHVEREVPADA